MLFVLGLVLEVEAEVEVELVVLGIETGGAMISLIGFEERVVDVLAEELAGGFVESEGIGVDLTVLSPWSCLLLLIFSLLVDMALVEEVISTVRSFLVSFGS